MTQTNTRYQIGDTLWFANGCKSLTEGKVVHIFEWANTVQYVLEYYAIVDWSLECRDYLTLSETPEGPLNLSKLAKEAGVRIRKRMEEWDK